MKDIELFSAFLETEVVSIAKVKETHIKKFNLHLHDLGYSNHTIARKNSSLRLYLKFLRKEGVMVHNPMEDIKQPKLGVREERFTEEDFHLLLQETLHPRDQLLLSLTFLDKIKVRDILKLKKNHYEKNQGILYLPKKAVLVHAQSKVLLDRLFEEENEYFVFNQHGKPLTESGAYFVFKQFFEKIGKPELRPIDVYKKQKVMD